MQYADDFNGIIQNTVKNDITLNGKTAKVMAYFRAGPAGKRVVRKQVAFPPQHGNKLLCLVRIVFVYVIVNSFEIGNR